MKAISAAIVVASGSAMLIAACSSITTWSRDSLLYSGYGVLVAGLIGWVVTLKPDK